MPDPLIWQAGMEYGLQALASINKKNVNFLCSLPDRGPMLEAIGFAAHQLKLNQKMRYTNLDRYTPQSSDVILMPRVYPLDQKIIGDALKLGGKVITSDPNINVTHAQLTSFSRRNWRDLADILSKL